MSALPTLRLPDIDLPAMDRPTIDLTEAITSLDPRRRRRSRWPFALGALVATGLATWALVTNPQLRTRVARIASGLMERVATIRSNRDDQYATEPIAFPAAETKPIDDSSLTDGSGEAPDYPAGLGSNNGDVVPEFETSRRG
jgi:hypothetical protein